MSCEWSEKVSLLVDGELAPREARLAEAHVSECVACRQAREDFLALRGRLASLPHAVGAEAARRALEKVLAAAAADHAGAGSAAERPERPARLPWSPWRPAFASAFALLLLAAALGLVWFLVGRVGEPTQVAQNSRRDGAGAQLANQKDPDGPAAPSAAGRTGPELTEGGSADSPPEVAAPGGVGRGTRRPRPMRATSHGGGAVVTVATRGTPRGGRREDPLAEFVPLFEAADAATDARLEAPAGDTERHFEQAQLLLRSFRNARPAAVADERRRSQRLLYRNIVRRREAARAGDRFAERALDTLEPILIDIANLPERPRGGEVAEVLERMRRKNIVAVLQANIAAAPRAY